ncbi:signal peptidase I [Adhaeretor mobilis]|uniref:Signal peptidase I n=1 Tax=Adhaeretor mobilis TaxID=1930276 RepID=A0A517MR93_9BACT|nr:signal peptidase I [Adhaeretor mobilis]QDS97400.1 signal peptidase I [Adhaeretor mobilis]
MSKKNRKNKQTRKNSKSEMVEKQSATGGFHTFRESLESIVIAFVLAFLFRTFEAEAFVIPTGSMSPSLLGRHKDVDCPECGYRFRITDSEEENDEIVALRSQLRSGARSGFTRDGRRISREDMERAVAGTQVVGGVCPMCRHTMPVRPDLPADLADQVDFQDVEMAPSYPGDRILVNKYGFTFNDPERWDVVVFKYPGNSDMNYIKRLVGLPNERLRVYQGDLFALPLDDDSAYTIQQKPPEKVLAMLQPVHDTDYEASEAYEAGWPLRWAPADDNGWEVEVEPGEQTVEQVFRSTVGADPAATAWLRYRHLVPSADQWQAIRDYSKNSSYGDYANREEFLDSAKPLLIADFNPYNAKLSRRDISSPGSKWEVATYNQGLHWVGDLALRCHVEVEEAAGQLSLDLVEAGKHFRAVIDLASGAVELQVVDSATGEQLDFTATGQTAMTSAGSYTLLFANVDDQLLLWIDDELVEFDRSKYDPVALFGERKLMIPWTGKTADEDQGDLAPAGVGSTGAKLVVSRLEVMRDIYYLANSPRDSGADYPSISDQVIVDGKIYQPLSSLRELLSDPAHWPRFLKRREVSFKVGEDQFFVMGDNSPFSQDARLWSGGSPSGNSKPGGAYLDRRLLIGKAVCVFWPHSWGSIPGLPKLPGFPNFGDMRLVR